MGNKQRGMAHSQHSDSWCGPTGLAQSVQCLYGDSSTQSLYLLGWLYNLLSPQVGSSEWRQHPHKHANRVITLVEEIGFYQEPFIRRIIFGGQWFYVRQRVLHRIFFIRRNFFGRKGYLMIIWRQEGLFERKEGFYVEPFCIWISFLLNVFISFK